ncbi:tail protein X [Bradyrhizobium sp. YCK136]|uniref:Phage tail protein X n=1 Tax=Bradyrhizobium elkanii TaxID=29448 RepID=A0ABV4F1J4_BRAEL|nr:tail protein X [Bradyrhizobium elkanii]MCP1757867.1 phage tail protein X [Bradyrhizobium elkanii]MCS3881836.1 phage tail protein X [Bradyrhizobium elkanii]MCS4218595.1 phage tail protein X [Bradyrhizobium elkanii]MCW2110105.1 phage tail protein X [Bradyrhizobium elkanii]MCW2201523.1 phage tail protein X [Bradyrhizobium elkanii]
MATVTYVTKMFDRLDRICFERYGSTSNQIVEWVIEQNPGIEERGMVLPLGLKIDLPEAPRTLTAPPVLKKVFLWE